MECLACQDLLFPTKLRQCWTDGALSTISDVMVESWDRGKGTNGPVLFAPTMEFFFAKKAEELSKAPAMEYTPSMEKFE